MDLYLVAVVVVVAFLVGFLVGFWASTWVGLDPGEELGPAEVPLVAPPMGPEIARPLPLTVSLRSGSGKRELGTVTIHPRERRPTLSAWASDGTRSVFQASHQEGDVWVYRRTGVEPGGRT